MGMAMIDEMRPWQFGIHIDVLKRIEEFYHQYNSYAFSPFAKFKKNDIAKAMKNKELVTRHNIVGHNEGYPYVHQGDINAAFTIKKVKTKTLIYAYNDVVIGYKEKGDIEIKHLAGNYVTLHANLTCYQDHNCWLYVWAEDKAHNSLAKESGFKYVFGKITTFGEIYSIYFRPCMWNKDVRIHRGFPTILPEEKINIQKLFNVDSSLINAIGNKLTKLEPTFTDHYSNYNKNHAWSAISLRGYTNDPQFITKPSEMNEKWHKQYDNSWIWKLQDTPLYKKFPEVKKLLSFVDGDIHRIRFMCLAPNEGELQRHTDLVDSEIGVKQGNIIRLHFPIITNPKVKFTSWNYDGKQKIVNMKVGECWYLDIRKPHRAINGGKERRIHLVIDVEVTPKILEILNGRTSE